MEMDIYPYASKIMLANFSNYNPHVNHPTQKINEVVFFLRIEPEAIVYYYNYIYLYIIL
jgi:hypothetical protein